MPVLDLPLQELKQYTGISPRPEDFRDFWLHALEELDRTDPEIELVPADFQTGYADCFHLYFTGVRKARIHMKLLLPKNSSGQKIPGVVHFHGYSGDGGGWAEKLPYVAAGYAVAALDCRGQGGLSQDTGGTKGTTFQGLFSRGLEGDPNDMIMRHVYLDTVRAARILMERPEIDERNISVYGGSQGGALSLACAGLEPRIRKAAVYYPFLSDFRRVWEMDLAKDAYEELRTYFRKFDPLHEREDEVFYKLGYLDVRNHAANIKAQVFFCATLMDNICPPSTQFAAYNHIQSPKEMIIYPDYGHEFLPGIDDRIYQYITGK